MAFLPGAADPVAAAGIEAQPLRDERIWGPRSRGIPVVPERLLAAQAEQDDRATAAGRLRGTELEHCHQAGKPYQRLNPTLTCAWRAAARAPAGCGTGSSVRLAVGGVADAADMPWPTTGRRSRHTWPHSTVAPARRPPSPPVPGSGGHHATRPRPSPRLRRDRSASSIRALTTRRTPPVSASPSLR